MDPARDPQRMTEADYLSRESTSDVRHEYADGLVYAMAGGTLRHAAITANVARALGNALVGKPCVVMSSDARIHVAETRLYTYPDITVLCGPAQTAEADRHALTNPTLVVEVLSESTEAHDRGAKAAHYRRLRELRAYLFVSSDGRLLELYERSEQGRWILSEAEGEPCELAIPSLGIALRVADVTRGLELVDPTEPT
jgi:Uma2 family endonuclease